MLKKFKFALGTALIAAAQLACADDAGVQISNLTLSTSGPVTFKIVGGDAR